MTKAGDRVPEGTFTRMTPTGPGPITTQELFGGKKVVFFAVPGAFTPTCSKQHLPGYVSNAEAMSRCIDGCVVPRTTSRLAVTSANSRAMANARADST